MSQPAAKQLISESELLTPQELAARLRVSARSVSRLVKGGLVPARAVLGRVRFYWPEVVASLPRVPAAASGRASEPGVATLDLERRLKLNSKNFYRNRQRTTPTQPGGAA